MRYVVVAASLAIGLAALAPAAHAGGVERSEQSLAILFESGRVAEVSFGAFSPDVKGTGTGAAPSLLTPSPGQQSGDMAGRGLAVSAALRFPIGPRWAAALIFDQPLGAEVGYPAGTGYFAAESRAELNANAVTAALKYTTPGNLSLIAGVRYQTLEATATVPFVASYTGTADRDGGIGYLLGVAYERPDIALRVALSYQSRVRHHLLSTEGVTIPGAGRINSVSDTATDAPQSLNLEAQTGIAPGTLLFGSMRWVEWSKFDISPALYATATGGGSLVYYDHDTITYTLGLGRSFSERWLGAATVSYEAADGGFASNLGPNDGFWSVGVGGTYAFDDAKVTAGLRYVDIGGADTTLGGDTTAARFDDNQGVALGIKIGFQY